MKKIICTLLLFSSVVLTSNAQKLIVATYNIRNANRKDSLEGNGWGQRFPQIAALIRFNDFDVVGTQEVLHNQLVDLMSALPGYAYVGVGRNDGKEKGEYAAIFFKKEKLDTIKTGHFWLSKTTDRPNKGWDAALPRICTWAHFREKNNGLSFWCFNLHMDHKGVLARKNSAELVLEKIGKLTNGEPVILTGDFNVDQTSESYLVVDESGILKDSYKLAEIKYTPNGTFNAFNPNLDTRSRIDHIFVGKGIVVKRYGILTDVYHADVSDSTQITSSNFPKEYSFKRSLARLPSDHFPVKVELEFMHFDNNNR